MAALLAGARLVLRQGLRFSPAYTLRPSPVPVRYLSSSSRLFTLAAQEVGSAAVESDPVSDIPKKPQNSVISLNEVGTRLKKFGRISKWHLLRSFEDVCKAGKPSDNYAWFFLRACGSFMPEVPMSERTEIANRFWKELQEMGVEFNVNHHNILLRVYLQNEHAFSPTEFLANMEAAQVEPDQSTYEELIAGYCNEGDIEGASKILGFMKSKNLPITEEVFSSLIKGHARSGDMESARNIPSVMREAGIEPRHRTYVALLNAYSANGDIESIKQILDNKEMNLTDQNVLAVIFPLVKSGHDQYVPDLLAYIEHGPRCTQGYGDAAMQVVMKLTPLLSSKEDNERQSGNFFLRHCVMLNMPVDKLKTYAKEMLASNMHDRPLQFLLRLALENNKTDMAIELMGVMKEKGLPVRAHYFWPMLTTFNKHKDIQGVLQTIKSMQNLEVELDVDTFYNYVSRMFTDTASAEAILKESGCYNEVNMVYLSVLRRALLNGRFTRACFLLSSSHIPLAKNRNLMHCFTRAFIRYKDAPMMATITGLLYKDVSDSQESSSLTESVGYFLYGVIDSMSDSEVQAMEEHLRQYFHQLKDMGITLTGGRCRGIIKLLDSHNAPQLIEDIKMLLKPDESIKSKTETIATLEEELESLEKENKPLQNVLIKLIRELCAEKELQKALQVKSKYEALFTFAMYMKLLGLCCKENNAQEALKLKQEVDQKGFTAIPTTNKYMSLLSVLTENDLIEDAINILKEMEEKDVPLNISTTAGFFHILNNLALRGEVEAVNRIHEYIVLLGLVKPKTNICSPLVMVHLRKDDIISALDAMCACANKYKCAPLQHEVLKILVERGETDSLKKAVDILSDLEGERVMLHDLFFAFIKTGKYAEAEKIIETPGMRAHSQRITWYTDRCLKTNEVDLLEKCVEMSRKLFGCDREDLYFQLLKIYDKNCYWERAKSVWYNMKEENITPQETTVNLIRSIFAKNDQDISEHIPEIEDGVGTEGFSQRVLNFCKDGNTAEAFVVFQKAEQLNRSLTHTAYRRLINDLLKKGLLEETAAVKSVAESRISDYRMSTTACNRLIEEQIRRDCLKDALVTLQMILENGSMPSHVMLRALIDALTMNGDLQGLSDLKAMMAPYDSSSYSKKKHLNNGIMFAHLQNGNFEEATMMMEELYVNNSEGSQTLYLFKKVIESNMEKALEELTITAERVANHFGAYEPLTELFIQYVMLGRKEDARQLLERHSAIVEQRGLLTYCIKREIGRQKKKEVFHLIELLLDPYYKKLAYGFQMRDYESNKEVDAAVALYEKMKAEKIDPDDLFLKRLAVLLRDAGKPVPFTEPPENVQYYRKQQLQHRSWHEE